MSPEPIDPIHGRYERTEDGRARIDLSVGPIDAIYNRFDFSVPFPNRNLAPALVQYLIDCATELGPVPFVICLHLDERADPSVEAQARDSLRLYFRYREALERIARRTTERRSIVLFGAGASLLAAVTFASARDLVGDSVAVSLATQGLTVAAWLLLWESFGTWFLHWSPARDRLRLHRALAEAEVWFVARPG